MERKLFLVTAIRGDYALLRSEDGIETEMALALLPPETDEGVTIVWENFEYTVLE